jgi:hypothetical protein
MFMLLTLELAFTPLVYACARMLVVLTLGLAFIHL